MKSTRLKQKLDQKYVEPRRIVAQISSTLFRVDLLGLKSVHLVFYASLLKPFNLKGLIPYLDTPIVDTLRTFSDNVQEVDTILERKQDNTSQQLYYVKQTRFPNSKNSQELGVNISSNTLKQFQDKKKITLKRAQQRTSIKRRLGWLPKIKRDSS